MGSTRKHYTNTMMVAYGPVEDPQIALGIVIEYGGGGARAGNLVADIFDAYFALQNGTLTLPEPEAEGEEPAGQPEAEPETALPQTQPEAPAEELPAEVDASPEASLPQETETDPAASSQPGE